MVKDRSKLDAIQQCRNSYNPCENAKGSVQVNTLVPNKFSRLEFTSNACGCPTQIKYYDDTVAEINTIKATKDTSNNLDSKYFNLFSAQNDMQYYVWYCTNCACSDPAVPCATGIKICVTTNDAAPVVALATQQQIDLNVDFSASVCGDIITITNSSIGLATQITNGCGLCSFTYNHVTEGCNRLTATVCFTYDPCGNVTEVRRT